MNVEDQWSAPGIPYYDHLMQGEQAEVTECIRQLLRQTFILERKYDKRTARFQYNRDFRICTKHLDFIRNYFSISGITLRDNSQMGVIYIEGETLVGDKLPKLATLYLLALKLIYDEQMESVSTSIQVYASLKEVHEKLGNYRLFKRQPSPTEIRRAIALLKKYQIVESLDLMEDLGGDSRMIIYPCINVVLLGDDVRQLLGAFEEEGENQEESPDSPEEAGDSEEMAEEEEDCPTAPLTPNEARKYAQTEENGGAPPGLLKGSGTFCKSPLQGAAHMRNREKPWEEAGNDGTDEERG